MRVMVFVKATEASEAESTPTEGMEEMFAAMAAYNQQLLDAGILVSGDGLKPTRFAKRIHFDGADRTVIDGPFAAVNELVAGYWIWKVKDMDEAVAWARRCPNPMPGPSDLELRPFYEPEDFADVMTPEQIAQEEAMRVQLETKGA